MRYLGRNWLLFLAASSFGVAFGVFVTTWILVNDWVRAFLASESATALFGVIALTISILVFSAPQAIEFWRRYHRTQLLDNPPVQHADLLASGLFVALVTGLVVIHISRSQPTISSAVYSCILALLTVFFLWLLSSWVWSHRETASIDVQRNPSGTDGDYSDDPITRDQEDLLGRVPFVDRLEQQILQLPHPRSFVFALYGNWGEGKTSVLELLRRRLAKRPNVITIAFNPWYFADEAALVQAFYVRLEQELSRLYVLSGFHRTIAQYKNVLTSSLRTFVCTSQ